MQTVSRIITTCVLASVLITLGCATSRQVRTAGRLEIVDTLPAESAKGYVEFSTVPRDAAVIPIFLLDEQRRPHLLAAIGLSKGDLYSFRRHQTLAAEKVRVAVSPGLHTFMIERDGQIVKVPVETGKVTSVEVDYVLLQRGDTFVTYRISSQLFQPVPLREKG